MVDKIYINLREAESLVFNKFLVVPNKRVTIKKRHGEWRVRVFLHPYTKIHNENEILITAGLVKKYEIPDKEERLFTNHFKLPKGLIDAKSREVDEEKRMFPDEELHHLAKVKIFKGFWRGFIQNYDIALNNILNKDFSNTVLEIVNDLDKLSTFKVNLIQDLILNGFYPTKSKNDGKFYPEEVLRFNWLGAYIFSKFPEQNQWEKAEMNAVRNWLFKFLDKDNVVSISDGLEKIPEVLQEEYEFIIGYYIAASFYEQINTDDYYIKTQFQLANYNADKNQNILFWAIFFQSIFKDNLGYLYYIPSLQNQQLNIEYAILKLLYKDISIPSNPIELPTIEEKEALRELNRLKYRSNIQKPFVVSIDEVGELLENKIGKYDASGFLFPDGKAFKLGAIRYSLDSNMFNSKINEASDSVMLFMNSSLKDKMAAKDYRFLKINSLINKKDVLIGFIKIGTYENSRFGVYAYLLKTYYKNHFKEKVFVIMVDEDVEYIQSPEFQIETQKMKKFLENEFGGNVHMLVKNKRSKSDGEIKRNLKHLIGGYKIENIELINENVDKKVLEWIISTNEKYFLSSNISSFYSFINA